MRGPHISRERDEAHLVILNCWEDGWSAGEIEMALPGVTRCAALGVIHRINEADPEALMRRPQPLKRKAA